MFRIALATLFVLAAPRAAEACGGFFCANQPVVQTGERIVFTVDHDTRTVEALIQIDFQGAAEDFAWVLPLSVAPTRIRTGSSLAFRVLEQMTAPRFTRNIDRSPSCFGRNGGLGGGGGGGVDAGAAAAGDAGAGVSVLSQGSVGPYDSVVLESRDPAALRAWLEMNGYRVTDAMMEAVTPYLAKGDVLLALKLQKDATVGELQPVELTLEGTTEACVPIRLTAIAAQDDMGITAFVLSRRGRAVPMNYLHVTPNLARIDWMRFGANYRQIIGEAADEAGGNAFTTEFAGPSTSLAPAIGAAGTVDLGPLRASRNARDLLQAIQWQGLNARPELRGILVRHLPAHRLVEAGIDPTNLWQCPSCYFEQLAQVAVDGNAFADEVDERILAPDRRARAMFEGFSQLTRLFTVISPEEMNVDPIFGFDERLPEVSNQHSATIYQTCDGEGRIVQQVLELSDGSRFALASDGQLPANTARTLPAAQRVDDLPNGRVVVDNTTRIASMSGVPIVASRGCGCESSGSGGLAGLALLALLLIRSSFRSRSSG